MKLFQTQIEYFASLPQIVKCTCRDCFKDIEELKLYDCEMCNRSVPWCYGMADDDFELCDDCTCRVHPEYLTEIHQ